MQFLKNNINKNCIFTKEIFLFFRHDPIHAVMRYTHQDLRIDVGQVINTWLDKKNTFDNS